MDSYNHSVPSHSLQTEVDAYFLNTVTTSYTSVMTFWQVCTQLMIVDLLTFTSVFCRRTSFITQQFLCSQWMSWPSKALQCPVSVFFHQGRKQCLHATTESGMILW